jgi:DNA primase
MVDESKKQDRQQEQAERQTRIKDAVADFFHHGLKEVRQARARRDDLQGTLFNSTTQRTAQP